MPNGKVHAAIGIACWYSLKPEIALLPTVIGALMPDCDIKYAPAGKFFPLWILPGVKHRGITHTVWGLVGFSSVVYGIWGLMPAAAFAVGYVSHLLADMTTPMGIDWIRGKGTKKRTYRQR